MVVRILSLRKRERRALEFPINTIAVDAASFTASGERSPSYSTKVVSGAKASSARD